ncbi:mucin-2-like [Liolophura sinensis]|uniref:mucin-2-like n=1 Tax=Liolophura sinensis TaxID=3198878 RepID=UPI00315977A4
MVTQSGIMVTQLGNMVTQTDVMVTRPGNMATQPGKMVTQLGKIVAQKVVNVEKIDGQSQVEFADKLHSVSTDIFQTRDSETQTPSTVTSVTPTQTASVRPQCQQHKLMTSLLLVAVPKITSTVNLEFQYPRLVELNQREIMQKETCAATSLLKFLTLSGKAPKEAMAYNCNETPDIGQTPNQVIEKGDCTKDNLCCSQTWQPASQSSIAGNSTCNLVPTLVSGNNSQCALQDTKALNLESFSIEKSLCVDPLTPVSPSLVTNKVCGKVATSLEKPGSRCANTVLTPVGNQYHHSKEDHTCTTPETSLQGKVIKQCTVLSKDDTSASVKIMPAVQPSGDSVTTVALERKDLSTPMIAFCTTQVQTARCSGLTKPATVVSKSVTSLEVPPVASHGTNNRGCGQYVTDTRQGLVEPLSPVRASLRVPQFSSKGVQHSCPLRNPKKISAPQIGSLETNQNPLLRTPPAVFTMGSLPSSVASARSCQLGSALSNQSNPPLTVNSVDKSVICADNPEKVTVSSSLPRNSPRKEDRDDPANETKLSPYSQFSIQLKPGYQDSHHLSQIQNFDVPSTPCLNSLPLGEDDPHMSKPSVLSVENLSSIKSTPVTPKGVLKDGLSSDKKTTKSVHFAGFKTRSPPKRRIPTDGDTPLFSDTEEEEGMELGSQMSSIQAILSPESPRPGRKRKHPQT